MSRHVLTLFLAVAIGSSLTLSAADITLGTGIAVEPQQVTSLPVSLTKPAPEGGVYVTLTSSDPNILTIRPSTIVIPAGSTVPYRLPQVTGVNYGSATVSATAYGLSGDSVSVHVGASLVGPTSATVERGTTQNLTFSLSLPTPSALTISLASDNPGVATVPSSVNVPAGASLAVVPVSGNAAGSTLIHVGGTSLAADQTISVTVTAPGMITLPGSLTVNEGQFAVFPVTLSTPAPPNGVTVSLQSSDPARVSITPSSVFISGGAVSPTIQPRVNALNIGGAVISASAAGYQAASATVAVPATLTFSPATLTLTGPEPGKLLLALSASAPWGIGLTVQLSSSNPSVATVQPTADFYPDGSAFTTVVVLVTPHGPGTTIISASAPPYIPTAVAVVTTDGAAGPPSSISVSSGSLQSTAVGSAFASALSALVQDASGNPVSGATVTFTLPSQGATAAFNGPNTAVTNAAGIATSAPLLANLTPGTYPVSATVPGVAQAAIFSLTNAGASLGSVLFTSSASPGPSQSVALPVSLSAPAPAPGITIKLSSSDPSKVTVTPTSVFIPAGATVPDAAPQLTGVDFGSATITGTAAGYSSGSELVLVKGALSFSPSSLTIRGKATQSLTLMLSSPAPANGLVVSIASSDSSVVSAPAVVSFQAGATSVSVPLTGVNAGNATITASSAAPNVTGATAAITVQRVSDISVGSGVTVEPGQSVSLPVSLAQPAPPGGVYVSLVSSDPSVLNVNRSDLYFPEGSTAPIRLPQINAFQFGAATITASAYGLTGDSQTVVVAASLFGPASANIDRGTTQNITFALSSPTNSALSVTLTSDNPGVASVPASVTIPANGTVAFIPITGISVGSTTIHVGGPLFAGDKALTVNVAAPGSINLLSNVTVQQGQSAPFNITLGSPAPSYGVTVTLTSSDPARVTVSPSTVFIAGGSVTPATQPQVNGLNIGASTITATAPGYLSSSQAVAVPATISISPANLTLDGSSQGRLLIALSASAPWGIGLTVNLTSSDPSVATVPPTIDFYPDGSAFTTVTVLVTPTGGHGTTVIHASAPPFIAETTATVTVP